VSRNLREADAVSGKRASVQHPSAIDQILSRTQSGREMVQDFVPLAESLEWELGQQYLKERGSAAFTADANPVPYVVNNSGELSSNAAEVLFESLERSAVSDQWSEKDDIYVLELGIGVGLFARFFLDHFRDLCRRHGRDYYDRLCYIAADRSPRMLLDVARHGILANHAGRYRLRVVDALKVDECLPYDVCFERSAISGQRSERKGRFHAVFLNYLLDCLPAAVLDVGEEEVKQLCVRTCVARRVNLADFTDMSLGMLQERAKSSDPRVRQELLECYGVFASEYEYRPLAMKNEERKTNNEEPGEGQPDDRAPAIPYLDFAVKFAREHRKRVLHNYGAIQCLEKLLGLLHPGGFILMNEYGMTKISEEDDFEHQRFSQTTAVGLNFPLLKGYFENSGQGTVGRIVYPSGDDKDGGEAGRIDNPSYGGGHSALASRPAPLAWLEPEGDEKRGIHTRLVGWDVADETIKCFQERFALSAFERTEAPVNKARECVKAGRFELAASLYRQALDRQPSNWVLLSEVASFLTYSLGDPKAGADLAKLGIRLNPACSSDLWCTLGDALFEWGRTAEAKAAYLRALAINPGDVRARFNLAFVHTRAKNYRPALAMVADALALDKTGQYRERLLAKQAEVLQLVAVKYQAEYLRMVNLVSKPASTENSNDKTQNTNKAQEPRSLSSDFF